MTLLSIETFKSYSLKMFSLKNLYSLLFFQLSLKLLQYRSYFVDPTNIVGSFLDWSKSWNENVSTDNESQWLGIRLMLDVHRLQTWCCGMIVCVDSDACGICSVSCPSGHPSLSGKGVVTDTFLLPNTFCLKCFILYNSSCSKQVRSSFT